MCDDHNLRINEQIYIYDIQQQTYLIFRELDIKADHNEKLTIQFEDKIKDLETKLNLAEKENTSTPKARTGKYH